VRAYLAGIRASGRKTHLFHAMIIFIKTIILPRQARDKHRKS
jgi:hypothetical protein